jgi:ParB family chromosome partitioning protein
MKIIDVSMDQLKPYEKNPRKNDMSVDYVAESIAQFGFKVPILIDKNNIIIAGHTRYKAAKKLGFKTVPCIVADDLTEEQVKAFRLVDNKVSENSEWDLDLLEFELDSIFDIDMEGFGFNVDLDVEATENNDNFNHIEALLNDVGISAGGGSKVKRYFDLTLSFPEEEKEVIDNYLKKIGGRRFLEERILKEAKEQEEEECQQ